jgi:hypothetical protein
VNEFDRKKRTNGKLYQRSKIVSITYCIYPVFIENMYFVEMVIKKRRMVLTEFLFLKNDWKERD